MCNPVGGRIVIFKDTRFRGDAHAFRGYSEGSGVRDLRDIGMNDEISSIIVTSGTWELYQDVNYRGRKWTVSPAGGNFAGGVGKGLYRDPSGWGGSHDNISSMKCVSLYPGVVYQSRQDGEGDEEEARGDFDS